MVHAHQQRQSIPILTNEADDLARLIGTFDFVADKLRGFLTIHTSHESHAAQALKTWAGSRGLHVAENHVSADEALYPSFTSLTCRYNGGESGQFTVICDAEARQ